MQLKYLKTAVDAQPQLSRIAGLSCAPNQHKVAVATADRSVLLLDDGFERRDRFSTKPSVAERGKHSYAIRAVAFSADSARLAVAQSDNIVYVYKLGAANWTDKKVICNKFAMPASVMAIVWLAAGPIVAGLETGQVRALNCKTNKSQALYATESTVMALASNVRGTAFVCAHADGSVVRFHVADAASSGAAVDAPASGRLFTHSTAAVALAWTHTDIVAAGVDRRVVFYNAHGQPARVFDYARDDNEREFMCAACSPNGLAVAVGSFDRVRVYAWSPRQQQWTEAAVRQIDNLYSVTALAWRRDGARLLVGSVCGAVLVFDAVLRRTVWQDKFELTYVAPGQVLLRSLLDRAAEPMVLESRLGRGWEIEDVRIMGKDSYCVCRTDGSLIVADLTRNLCAEVAWSATGRHERFYFENPTVCLVFNAGELSLIEYGVDAVLATVRTEFVNPHVISVRLNERQTSGAVETKSSRADNKKLAYLLDQKTICIVDLVTRPAAQIIAQIAHDSKIDWLELSETGERLLFRDRKMRLWLVAPLAGGRKLSVLGNVSWVQWVPQSDVAVAQSGAELAVWYNMDMPEHVQMMAVRGDVVEVVRDGGRTEVRTREGHADHAYRLDEGLVEFGTAVNDSDFGRAVLYLESLADQPAAKAMWHNLAGIALQQRNLWVAQRAYAALGNASRAFYLGETLRLESEWAAEHDEAAAARCPEVEARLALMRGDLRAAERIYLEQGQLERALEMYKRLHRWDDAVRLAERRGYAGVAALRDEQMAYLLGSRQEELAGRVLEDRGEPDQAMALYMRAGKAARAARLALKMPHLMQDDALMHRVGAALVKAELFELAGDLSHRLQQPEAAIAMYQRGGAFARAIDLARTVQPELVTGLEEEWGDWLVGKRQLDAAISHYIEAGATVKALEAAVGARQFKKALQIAKVIDDPAEIKKYGVQLADHLIQAGDPLGAQEMLVRAEQYREAVDLLNRHGEWERAHELAAQYLGADIVRDMFIEMAARLEQEARYRDAEKVLLTIDEPDMAISMYKRLEQFDAMIRLVERFHRDLVPSTHSHLARQLEAKQRYKAAEVHHLAADDWKAAVHMYGNAGRWEEAHRVAKQQQRGAAAGAGAEGAADQVAYMWARSLPIEAAVRLLQRMQLVERALGIACEAGQYPFALELCAKSGHPADGVHLKMAMELEDEGKFADAEREFLAAGKPKEAILMHTHSRDWAAAVRVAEQHLPDAVVEVLLSQAAEALQAQNYGEYEALLIRANRTDVLLQHYREYEMWQDAVRIAKEYVPSAVAELQRMQAHAASLERQSAGAAGGAAVVGALQSGDSRELLQRASEFARREEFRRAADCLLLIDETNADAASVERALLRCAEIGNQFLEGADAVEVARQLGPRLVELRHIGPAAQLYLAADLPRDAVQVFMRTDQWSKARRLAKEIGVDMVAYVEAEQKQRLRMEGNVEQLADIDIVGALDLLAEQGQWTRCLDKAKQHSPPVHHKYLALYAAQLLCDGDPVAALGLYQQGAVAAVAPPPLPQNINIYTRITVECLALREQDALAGDVWRALRSFLLQVVLAFRSADPLKGSEQLAAVDRFDDLLLIVHYYAMRAACREVAALSAIALRLSVAVLRYTEHIPVDKAFYEAGQALRQAGRDAEAFVMLNHYLDVCDAIEGAETLVDHLDLTATDIPSSVPIPERMHLAAEPRVHEDIRDWVLAISMDQRVEQQLPVDEARGLHEASLGTGDVACLVSGYPVGAASGRSQPVTFQRSQRLAAREAWSKLTVAGKMAPHSAVPDVLAFVEKWCGVANFMGN